MGHSREVFHSGGNVSSKDTAKMKLLGFVLLLTFLVSTLGAPLVREELEETQWQAQDVLVLDESLKDMSENGIKDLWEMVKAVLKKYFGQRKAELEKMVFKYAPEILKLLQRFSKHMKFQLR